MSLNLKTSLIIILSILAILALAVYGFFVYRAYSAVKQIERLNGMINVAALNGNVLILQFDIKKSLNILQFDTINRYTNQIVKIYQENFVVLPDERGMHNKHGIYSRIVHHTANGIRTILININPSNLEANSELEKKCIAQNKDFKTLPDKEKQNIIFDCITAKMKEFGEDFLKKEKETSIFLKPFKSNPEYEKVNNPLGLMSLKDYIFGQARCH